METRNRVGLGAVAVGVIVSLGVAVVFLSLAAAAFISFYKQPTSAAYDAGAVWIAVTVVASAFAGGRFAAVNARAITDRDGALCGLVTWAAIAGVTAAGVLAAIATGWLDPTLPGLNVEATLWAVVVAELSALVAAIVGGVRGARAEARAIGIIAVRRRDSVDDIDAYERGFFAEDATS